MAYAHAVHFYEDPDGLIKRLTAYIEKGLHSGGSVIVIARNSFLLQLKMQWLPAFQDRFVGLDADKTLTSFMVDGFPDRNRFMQAVGGLVSEAAQTSSHVYAFGEMVNLLWKDGKYEAALQLEELWNDLAKQYPLTLLCAYAADLENVSSSKSSICELHSQVIGNDSSLSAPAS
jgi:hypothetical protein